MTGGTRSHDETGKSPVHLMDMQFHKDEEKVHATQNAHY
jgi:hypothetical protein